MSCPTPPILVDLSTEEEDPLNINGYLDGEDEEEAETPVMLQMDSPTPPSESEEEEAEEDTGHCCKHCKQTSPVVCQEATSQERDTRESRVLANPLIKVGKIGLLYLYTYYKLHIARRCPGILNYVFY